MSKIKPIFKENVSETLLIPLYMRAMESKEANPIIVDKKSEEILSKVNYDFNKFSADKRCQFCISIRTKFFDDVVRNFVQRYNDAVVVLIACGLDPRIERLELENDNYHVYELDFLDVINLRRELLPESENNVYLTDNITNNGWIQSIKAKHTAGHFLFVLEGVAMYLTEEQVKGIFKNIDDNFEHAEIYIERMNEHKSKRTHKQKSVNKTKALFSWGCDSPKAIEKWSDGIKLKDEFYYYIHGFKESKKRFGLYSYYLKYAPYVRRSMGIWGYEKK